MRNLEIYVSGLYSGTNPQPGVGIARSLRQGYPEAKLIGVEYSTRCSGIHWRDFDEIWLQRPWSELDLDLHAAEIEKRLDEGGLWISSIDLEIAWLAERFPSGHRNLLAPTGCALKRVAKPAIEARDGLDVRIPEFVSTRLSDWELHAFCRKHDWKVWLKGPYYEAVRTPSWAELQHWRGVLSKAWATDDLYLQAHVTGYEESYMFCADRGELLDCVHMRKRDVTELGKTWAGDTAPLDEDAEERLRGIVRELEWTGGGELEMIRDANDDLWLLEWNPRFPAWVHGSTITGRNLPAALVESACGAAAEPTISIAPEFTRVVVEIPVRDEFPLGPLAEPLPGGVGHSMKHPSGLIEFAQRLHKPKISSNGHAAMREHGPEPIPQSYLSDLRTFDLEGLETPASLYFEKTANRAFRDAGHLIDASRSEPRMSLAYSIKTNPDERLLRLAKQNGLLAEAISPLEAKRAVEVGFSTSEIVLNGPAKWWRRELLPDGRYRAVFCDSIEELERSAREVESGELRTSVLGVRLRTPNIVSRFGVPIDSPELFEKLIRHVRLIPESVDLGVHFHMASSGIGVGQWRGLFDSMLRWCASIETLTGRAIRCLDTGGGWFPGDRAVEGIRDCVAGMLPNVEEVIAEPGKALSQSSMALAMRVLEIRRFGGGYSEAVVDGSIAELPMHAFQPHRILCFDHASGQWHPLGRGRSMLLGRLCMEHDIVAANVALPDHAREGDVLVFCDAGAYDRSMSYVFGCG